MSRFEISKGMVSCAVNIKLLQELEFYLKSQAATLNIPEDRVNEYFEVTIKDKYGTETLKTTNEYKREYLPSDTKEISINFGKLFVGSVKIRFNSDIMFSKIEIFIESDSSKEAAHGILHAIEARISENKTMASCLHGYKTFVVYGLLSVIIGGALPNLYNVCKGTASVDEVSFLFIAACFYFALKLTFPYCHFDTVKNQKKVKIVKWLFSGAAGMVLFGTIGKGVITKVLP